TTAGDAGVHRRGRPTTQMSPRRRNPKGAWVLRAIAALLVVDDVHRHRLPPRALRSHRNTHARDPFWLFQHPANRRGTGEVSGGRNLTAPAFPPETGAVQGTRTARP